MISIRSKHLKVIYRYVTIAEDLINWSHMKRGWTYIAFVSVLIAAAVLLRYFDPFFVSALRLIAFDGYQRLHPEQYDPQLPIRIVDIDEQSLSKIGQWPWPRTTIANLVEDLASKGAAVVGFDVLFAEPDRTSAEEIAKRLPAAQGSALLSAAEGKPTNDEVFAAALKQTPSVLSVSLGPGSNPLFKPKAGFAVAGQDPRPFIINFSGATKIFHHLMMPHMELAHSTGRRIAIRSFGALRLSSVWERRSSHPLRPKRFGSRNRPVRIC